MISSFLKSNHSLLYHFAKPYRLSILSASLFSLALSICATAIAVLIGPALHLLMDMDFTKSVSLEELFGPKLSVVFSFFFQSSSINLNTLISTIPTLLLGIGFLKLILGTAQYFLWEKSSEQLTRDLRLYLSQTYLSINPSLRRLKHHEELESSLSSLLTNDVKMAREYFVHFYGGLPRETLHIIFIGQTLFLLSPKLLSIFLFGVLPTIALIQKFGRKLKKRAKLALQDYADLTEWLQQRLLGIETIKHFESESLEAKKMETHSEQLLKTLLRAVRVKAKTGPILEFLGITAMALVLCVAFHDIQTGNLQASAAISFFAGLAIVAQSGSTLGRYLNSNREGSAALERIRNFLQLLENDSYTIKELPKSVPSSEPDLLILNNVTARYPETEQDALHSFSYSFKKGKIYCIKGHSGSGKSTLFNLILGNLTPKTGTIQFNESVHKEGLGYLPQNHLLFNGSIQENIIYPHKVVKLSDLKKVLKSLQLLDFFQKKENGLDTLINPGFEFSGGQNQRIHIARLLYHSYPLLLIDEGTSALDPINESLIYSLLAKKVRDGATIIMISHRPTPTQFADETLYLENGYLIS